MTATYARVALAAPVPSPLSYAAPPALAGLLAPGHVVEVPLGTRQVTGYVLDTHGPEALPPDLPPERVKPIVRLLEPQPAFDARQLELFRWVARYYHAGLGEVIATALPSALKAGTRAAYRATEDGVEALAAQAVTGEDAEVLRELVRRPEAGRRGLERTLHDLLPAEAVERALERLLHRGWAEREQLEVGGPAGDMARVLVRRPEAPALEAVSAHPSARQRAVVDAVAAAAEGLALDQLAAEQGPYARTVARRLVALGVLDEELRPRLDPVVLGELPARRDPPPLTPAQQQAVDHILGPPQPWLLYGVTGAGKTEVYLHAAQAALAAGRQVLVLVPEIGLTPLLTGRFRARFGGAVAVLHSGLTGAQRLREWRRIRAGEAQVAVGARSALFAPFQALGLVVVDEEHDDSYKQDEGVRYNARDLAVVRARQAGCPVVLGSATPSMESWHNAREGRYGLLELLERPTPRPVPAVELVDLRRQPRVEGRLPLLSDEVLGALRACFAGGGKAIVLYNRRGYASFVQCGDCGGAYTCPSCGVGLVLHQTQGTLSCHYCGFHRGMPGACPSCGGALEILGRGTERVEEHLRELFPEVPIARMDADTTAPRGAHHQILQGFARGDTQLLVGTQIVAKGHDFPDVHLAVVVSADHSLMMPDFRAAERTWALLTQLAGRAGRGEVAGRVLVQTLHPEHYTFQKIGDPQGFFEEEGRARRTLRYPPFTRLALLRVESADRDRAVDQAWVLARRLRLDRGRVEVLGPSQAALPRLVGRWRYQVLLRGADPAGFLRWLSAQDLSAPRGVRVVLDVDPRSLL